MSLAGEVTRAICTLGFEILMERSSHERMCKSGTQAVLCRSVNVGFHAWKMKLLIRDVFGNNDKGYMNTSPVIWDWSLDS